MNRRKPLRTRLLPALFALVLLTACQQAIYGQASWEYAPYQVRVLLALQPAPQLPPALLEPLADSLSARAETVFGAVWDLKTAAAPSKLSGEVLAAMDSLQAEMIAASVPPADLNADKQYLAAVAYRGSEFHVAVREFDCRTRQLGPSVGRRSPTAAGLPSALWDAIAASFVPLARIDAVDESRVTMRLRAGGLVTDPASAALVEAGMVMRPIIRRNDKNGQPLKGGIQAVPWTLLEVSERRDSLVGSTLYSGYRIPIPARGGARLERLALLAPAHAPATRLLLRARDNPNKPLSGYEILARSQDQEPELMGLTDSHGAIDLPRGDGRLRMLYVRSGRQLMVRLPIVPGQAETLIASIPDDDRRLEAEGFVAALSSRALDLVARREILAARIRVRLKEGELSEAERLLETFRKLETRADISRDLNQYRQRATSSDKLTQQRIEKLLGEAQQILLLRALGDELLNQLSREITAARASGGTTTQTTAVK